MVGADEFQPTDPDLAARLENAASTDEGPLDALATHEAVRAGVFGSHSNLRFGRYERVSRLASGGMGVVYRAYDPQLERPVALKVLRTGAVRGAQLRAEARTLARLSHPNIVAVFDVAEIAGEDLLVMELVEGSSFESWLRTHPTAEETLDHLLQAGRGIAAAHAAGIVHRDIKPENILVSRTGRVRVADFGLAKNAADTSPRLRGGTPGYLAPECVAGEEASFASDQYAFAATGWRALTGHLPRGTPTLEEANSPALRALRRALAHNPAQRYEDFDALLRALAAAQRRGPHRWYAVGLLAAALLAASAFSLMSPPGSAGSRCLRTSEHLAQQWTGHYRSQVEDKLRNDGSLDASAVVTDLDRHFSRWQRDWELRCRPGQQTETTHPALCLRRRAMQLSATHETLADPRTSAEQIARASRTMADLEPCDDDEGSGGGLGGRARTLVVEQLLAEAEALYEVERYADARARLAGEDARIRWGTEHQRVRALQLRGLATWLSGERSDELDRAHALAVSAGLDARASSIALSLAQMERSEVWLRHAATSAERSGDDERIANVLLAKARMQRNDGHDASALGLADEAAALLDGTSGSSDVAQYNLAMVRGLAHLELGEFAEAEVELATAADLGVAIYGEEHDGLLASHAGLVRVHIGTGDLASADAVMAHLWSLLDRELQDPGARWRRQGMVSMSAAKLNLARGDADEAASILRASLEHLPAARPLTTTVRYQLAATLVRLRRYEEARREFESLQLQSLGEGGESSSMYILSTHGVGEASRGLALWASAEREFERSLALLAKAPPLAASMKVYPLTGLAAVKLSMGAPEDAVTLAEQALDCETEDRTQLAEARTVLSRALGRRDRPGDARRARSLAEAAFSVFASTPGYEQEALDVQRWLESL